MYEFGSGSLWAVPTISLAGIAITNPTPVPFGALQDISVDMSFTVKELYGLYQFPLAVGRGTAKLTAKAKAAKITASLFNLVFGEAVTTPAQNCVSFQESGTIPGTPYQVTVANSATWVTDLGALYASNMQPLTRVAPGTPATGQYCVTAGVYTFAAADTTLGVYISYIYTTTTTPPSGTKFTMNNQLLGLTPFFAMTLNQHYQGKHLTVTYNRCVSSKLTLATKIEDFNIPEIDIAMMADDGNVVGTISCYEF